MPTATHTRRISSTSCLFRISPGLSYQVHRGYQRSRQLVRKGRVMPRGKARIGDIACVHGCRGAGQKEAAAWLHEQVWVCRMGKELKTSCYISNTMRCGHELGQMQQRKVGAGWAEDGCSSTCSLVYLWVPMKAISSKCRVRMHCARGSVQG